MSDKCQDDVMGIGGFYVNLIATNAIHVKVLVIATEIFTTFFRR